MEDRFKFRVWKLDIGKWAESVWLDPDTGFCIVYNGEIYEYIKDEDFTIQQCTGLKDKNGVLIYEGDILEFPDRLETARGSVTLKEYEDSESYGDMRHYGWVAVRKDRFESRDTLPDIKGTAEIIGNIFENKELLTNTK